MRDTAKFDHVLLDLFKNITLQSESIFIKKFFLYRLYQHQKAASKRREKWRSKGVPVPPILISSITHQCNLKCTGCYASIPSNKMRSELNMEQWEDIYRQAANLGVSIIMIAGGEPLMKPELLDVLKQYRNVVFILFTNGMLLTPEIMLKLKKLKNVLPVISIDGMKGNHDHRRGKGTYDQIIHQMKYLKENNLRYGLSITVTKDNFNQVTNHQFVESIVEKGIQILFFIEFVPKDDNSTPLIISSKQQHELEERIKKFNEIFKKPFITFPGNEEQYGGCLAAGRGFIHIGTDGDVEPCPFAPFSDINITKTSLKESLQSNFLNKIRKNHSKLTETQGGCALWSNRNWVKSLLTSEHNQE